jgi:hypothetical protein
LWAAGEPQEARDMPEKYVLLLVGMALGAVLELGAIVLLVVIGGASHRRRDRDDAQPYPSEAGIW